jgi:hypothetical protein
MRVVPGSPRLLTGQFFAFDLSIRHFPSILTVMVDRTAARPIL